MSKVGFCVATCLVALWLAGCSVYPGQSRPEENELVDHTVYALLPQDRPRKVDLLLVVDNSPCMTEDHDLLSQQVVVLLQEIRGDGSRPVDLHLGLISTDVGVGGHPVSSCDKPEGDQGNLLVPGWCAEQVAGPFLVDAAPRDCIIVREAGGECRYHACTRDHCSHEPGADLVMDSATGCPRCRTDRFDGLNRAVECMIHQLGTYGCPFEQPLESLYLALSGNENNEGFLRSEALLAILFVTDEDDCSGLPPLYDPSDNSMDGPVGPLTSYRCFEHAVTCHDDSRYHQGIRHDCRLRSDPASLIHPLDRYVELVTSLKEPHQLLLSGLMGVISGNRIRVGLDEYSRPEVQYVCSTERGGSQPAFRLGEFIRRLTPASEHRAALGSICDASYTKLLSRLGQRIRRAVQPRCLPGRLKGCADSGNWSSYVSGCFGACRPRCEVRDVFVPAVKEARFEAMPSCLEVCEGGPCPGNTDAYNAYARGVPRERDPGLPVEACWLIQHDPTCPGGSDTALLVSRRRDPPPNVATSVRCLGLPDTETRCDDGLDDDEDCLIDEADPDCRRQQWWR